MDFTKAELENVRRQVEDEYGPGVPEELVLLEAEDMKRKGCVDLALDDCRKCPSSDNCPILSWTERHPEYKDDDFAKTLNALRAKARASC